MVRLIQQKFVAFKLVNHFYHDSISSWLPFPNILTLQDDHVHNFWANWYKAEIFREN